jgi:CDP-diacylglycerol--serine O-phosphatidyltransferase
MFTLMNLFMGFNAIIQISEGNLFKGGIFVLLAAVFDSLDGIVARLLKATSELGAELDSLCDAVSFGVAPSFMLYKAYFYQYGDYGLLLASLPALAGVTRLARFNIQLTSFEDKLYFKGLPIPGGALAILSYVLFFKDSGLFPGIDSAYMWIAVSVCVAGAMISTIKFDNMPRPSAKYIKSKPITFSLFLIGTLASIFTKGLFMFPFMALYIIISSIRHLYVWLASTIGAEDEIDESDDNVDNFE